MAEKNIKNYKEVKLTHADFEYFKERCKYWHKVLGLKNYELWVLKKDNPETDDHASVTNDKETGILAVVLNMGNTVPDYFDMDDFLDESAFHEVFEGGYLGRLIYFARSVYNTKYVDEISHSVVACAQNSIFEELR